MTRIRCGDCKLEVDPIDAYRIRPPMRPNHNAWYLCPKCWTNMTGLAFLGAVK